MTNRLRALLMSLFVFIILSGCGYTKSNLSQYQIPYKDQIASVQAAVNEFQKDNRGILPIKTLDRDTSIYEKYQIDFKKLAPKYMAEAPTNAFESGGVFQYVLIDVETNPTVKIFDLRMAEAIRDIKLRIKMQDYPPYNERIDDNVFSLNFQKLGYKEDPTVTSPFTNQELPFVVTGTGEVYVDYIKDLYRLMQDTTYEFEDGVDIRDVLMVDSSFVPAYSLPYSIDKETNHPIYMK